MVDPNSLLSRRFEKAKVGGYKTAEVDSFLVEVAAMFSQQSRETAEIKRKYEAAQTKIAGMEGDQSSLGEALLRAQRLADSMITDAKAQAEQIRSAAQQEAEKIVRQADEDIVTEQEKLQQLKREVSSFRSKLINIYRAHLQLINEIPAEREPDAESGAQGGVPGGAEEAAAADGISAQGAASAQQSAVTLADAQRETQAEAAAAEASQPQQPVQPQTPGQGAAGAEENGEIHDFTLNVKYDEALGEYIPIRNDQPDGKDRRAKSGK